MLSILDSATQRGDPGIQDGNQARPDSRDQKLLVEVSQFKELKPLEEQRRTAKDDAEDDIKTNYWDRLLKFSTESDFTVTRIEERCER